MAIIILRFGQSALHLRDDARKFLADEDNLAAGIVKHIGDLRRGSRQFTPTITPLALNAPNRTSK